MGEATPSGVQVRKVLRMVATSEHSWADAAARGIGEATKTIRDLDRAQVTRRDAVLRDGRIDAFRVQLEVSFRLDRRRVRVDDSGTLVEVRRYLVVANQTLASPGLLEALRERHEAGPSEFHVVVPATGSDPSWASLAAAGTPLGGGTLAVEADTLDAQRQAALEGASQRLEAHVAALEGLGATVTAELGSPDPYAAALAAIDRSSFDGVVVSTLPARLSKWVAMDLGSRLGRALPIPVSVYTPTE